MASLFRGMSKDNLLDSLVAASGKNGHELHNFLIELIDNYKAEEQKKEPVVEQKVRPNVPNYFEGSRDEFVDWACMYMTDEDSDVIRKWAGSMAHGYLATQIAGRLGLVDGGFTWIYKTHTMSDRPITIEYYVYKNREGMLEWSEEMLTEPEMLQRLKELNDYLENFKNSRNS